MAFQLPNEALDNCSGLFICFANWARDVTSWSYWVFALMAFAVILFLATVNRFGTNRAFGFGSFGSMIGAIYFAILGLIAWWVASAFILVGIVGIIIMIMQQR